MADGTEATVQITGSGGGLDQGQVDARIAAAEIPTTQLTGAFIKSITTSGLATVQLADGTETDVQVAGGGSGTDQVARDAAATAQTELDTHEASTHNEDATARTNAASAQTAAENAQTEVTTHAALPHNTDQVARDGVDTAQQAANAAGSAASDANAAAVTAAKLQPVPRRMLLPPTSASLIT